MGINYRCSDKRNCGKRVTLNQPIDHYARRPLCPECKKDRLKPTRYDNKCDTNRTCYCSGIGWPHRKGAIVSEHATCHHADPEKIEQLDLGVVESRTMKDTDDCPF